MFYSVKNYKFKVESLKWKVSGTPYYFINFLLVTRKSGAFRG